ncbi:hypothetical protein EYF80_036036 [Liparis tanakae]|uniref:Uncharacterized protein n=1 Tax=Liparis tanakae TaxID=230148 RepID=A0A4Z2GKE9_9TELE|nr:hypothetical protein EYF80_036036 [Liparis tanakae]
MFPLPPSSHRDRDRPHRLKCAGFVTASQDQHMMELNPTHDGAEPNTGWSWTQHMMELVPTHDGAGPNT